MRNPLQAALRRSCGWVRTQDTVPRRGTYAIGCQQDVQVPLRGTLSFHAATPTAAPLRGLQWVSYRGVPSAHPLGLLYESISH